VGHRSFLGIVVGLFSKLQSLQALSPLTSERNLKLESAQLQYWRRQAQKYRPYKKINIQGQKDCVVEDAMVRGMLTLGFSCVKGGS